MALPAVANVTYAHIDDCPDLTGTNCLTLPYGQTQSSPQPLGVRNTIPGGAMDGSPTLPLPLPTIPYTTFLVQSSPAQEGYFASIRSVLAMSSIVFQRALDNGLKRPPATQNVAFSLNVPSGFDPGQFNFALQKAGASCVAAGSLSKPDYCLVINLPTANEGVTTDPQLFYEWRQASLYAAADAILTASEAAFLMCKSNCPMRPASASPVPGPDPIQN